MNKAQVSIHARATLVAAAALALAAVSPVAAGYSSTSLVDVPASEYLDHMQYEIDLVIAVSADEEISDYGTLNFNFGIGGMSEVGVAAYSVWEEVALAAHFKVEAIDEEHFFKYQPAFSVGMDNLTIGDGIVSNAGNRHPRDTAAYDLDFQDNITAYGVFSKTIDPVGTFHVGWGTGRFVGEGPRSRKLRGVFAGYNRRIWKTFEIMIEEDGRDVNVGVRHIFPWITLGAAIEKAEQLWSPDFDPYYSITIEFSPRPLHTGPERLQARRNIRSATGEIDVLKRRIEDEQELVAALREEVYAMTAEYRDQGIDPSSAAAVNLEIERLERALEAARENQPYEDAPDNGGGI
jgi:hypothetical protein